MATHTSSSTALSGRVRMFTIAHRHYEGMIEVYDREPTPRNFERLQRLQSWKRRCEAAARAA